MPTTGVSHDIELRPKTVLRRYMDVSKLLDLLHFNAIYIRRADGFPDRLEGALFPSHRGFLERSHLAGYKPHDADHFYRRGRSGNYVSCWSRGPRDSMALWQLYGGARTSVAVITNVEELARVAISWNRNVVINKVRYIDHRKVKTYVIGSYADMLKYKHLAYEYEHEIRLIVPQQGEGWEDNPMGIRLAVPDMARLIRRIVVAPEATSEFVEVVKGLVARYGLRVPVVHSQLATAPV